ncbi:MAG: methyltransferase domain-containing protein [Porticoccaceae bacterium]|nr:methyltransferase domain-containing protein [Porticoccaceae bacterium]
MQKNEWQAASYSQHAAFVSAMATEVMALLAPARGEAILDLGCGDGELAEYIAAQGSVVTCIDASASMVESARARGLKALQMNGHQIDFCQRYDAVFSNAALHWMLQPEEVITGVHRALKAGGRFVAELGGSGNIAALLCAMTEVFAENEDFGAFENPWYFPATSEYRALLEKAGFRIEAMEILARPTPLASGIEKWLEVFANSICARLNAEQKARFFVQVKEKLQTSLYSKTDGWVADYVRLRFKAIKCH